MFVVPGEGELFYFHDFAYRVGNLGVVVQGAELLGLAADGIEGNETAGVREGGPPYTYFSGQQSDGFGYERFVAGV